jgi:hypothetical protein
MVGIRVSMALFLVCGCQVVAELIADRFAIELSLASVGKLLASLGLTPQSRCCVPMNAT